MPTQKIIPDPAAVLRDGVADCYLNLGLALRRV